MPFDCTVKALLRNPGSALPNCGLAESFQAFSGLDSKGITSEIIDRKTLNPESDLGAKVELKFAI